MNIVILIIIVMVAVKKSIPHMTNVASTKLSRSNGSSRFVIGAAAVPGGDGGGAGGKGKGESVAQR